MGFKYSRGKGGHKKALQDGKARRRFKGQFTRMPFSKIEGRRENWPGTLKVYKRDKNHA